MKIWWKIFCVVDQVTSTKVNPEVVAWFQNQVTQRVSWFDLTHVKWSHQSQTSRCRDLPLSWYKFWLGNRIATIYMEVSAKKHHAAPETILSTEHVLPEGTLIATLFLIKMKINTMSENQVCSLIIIQTWINFLKEIFLSRFSLKVNRQSNK